MRAQHSNVTTWVLAGVAGGLAEMAWVGAYAAATPLEGSEVLRQITASLLPALVVASPAAPAVGVAIHMGLAIAVGGAFALAARRFEALRSIPSALAALALVWMVNFMIVLPIVNPAFVDLMPYVVTLVSKLLFGAAMGGVLYAPRVSLPRRIVSA